VHVGDGAGEGLGIISQLGHSVRIPCLGSDMGHLSKRLRPGARVGDGAGQCLGAI
jgi:hypothetical protein